ncbi:hypothetical protein SNE35_13050 [Paucibacter sp. R3-3]|uniref:Trypsin n=1 Tax=Roseateles agri TaxID=3098619 RepID=A0ABU5DI98_9BURK|nr:hypothetical protein [Paucibacter sp. R3-3]MDY0745440.1 hypothetical protein [Paucibacter sp. R3-3]
MLKGLLLAGLALACAGLAHADARTDFLARGEAELQRGENTAALDDFERASMMRHEADAEIGVIRAAMQDGQYRRALAFVAHTAGVHLDHVDAGALYAWLLYVGGQQELARRTLAHWQERAPDDAMLAEVARAFAQDIPAVGGVLLQSPHRYAPWAVGDRPPADARFASNGVLIGDGSLALAPAVDGDTVWVRNGLGQASAATVDRSDAALQAAGLVLLRLQTPLGTGAAVSAAREPFAGGPGFALQFSPGTEPGWPILSQGFLGAQAGPLRRLGFALAGSSRGAPVLDRQGRLAGIVVSAPAGSDPLWLPLARWPGAPAAPEDAAPPQKSLMSPDQAYELGMRLALQVLQR